MMAIAVHDNKAKIDVGKFVPCGACIKVCKRHALISEKTGYIIFVGGSLGRRPKYGIRLIDPVDGGSCSPSSTELSNTIRTRPLMESD